MAALRPGGAEAWEAPLYDRPARKQPPRPPQQETRGGGGDYNIWYHKKPGSREPRRGPRGCRAATTCVLSTDAGRTRADAAGVRQFCIYFARGCCTLGRACHYLHRVPNREEAEQLSRDFSQDCFGRTRVPDDKDDRQGVGSSLRACTTLYVHYGGAASQPAHALKGAFEESFREWGPIRKIHLVPAKAIAFVHYEWRSSAEFAKEAMHAQCLKGSTTGEVLNVCWANDDPNPSSIRQVKRERADLFAAAYVTQLHGIPDDQKRARLHQMQLAATGAYPHTDPTYATDTSAAVLHGGQAHAHRLLPPTGASCPQAGQQGLWHAAAEVEDDVSRYCADDPYYDQEPEVGPPMEHPGSADTNSGPEQFRGGAPGAQRASPGRVETGSSDAASAPNALGLLAGYCSDDDSSDGSGAA